MLLPRGMSISVIRAIVFFPALSPMSTSAFESFIESSKVFIKAPLPVLTSKSIQSAPQDIFLLIIDEAIRGMASTVAVTSLRA